MFPLVFALLPGKSEQLYTRYFHLLKEACTQRQITLQPTTTFIDYETAVQNAARTSFPGITIKGCFFHYTQCIWRKVQNTGMQTHYSDDPIIHQLVRRVAVLLLVPHTSIEDVWFNALEDLEQSNPTTDPTSFTDYVTTYWVETRRHLWNHYLIQGPRTTNHLEGWHSKIKKQIQHAHPNISLEMPVPSQGHYGFQFSGCWLILSVYIIMSFDFPFVRLFGVR